MLASLRFFHFTLTKNRQRYAEVGQFAQQWVVVDVIFVVVDVIFVVVVVVFVIVVVVVVVVVVAVVVVVVVVVVVISGPALIV